MWIWSHHPSALTTPQYQDATMAIRVRARGNAEQTRDGYSNFVALRRTALRLGYTGDA
jgi:hypothetical protein